MFRNSINNVIDPIPVEYVNQLKRLSYEPDYSLTCLGIALLKDRIDNYGGIDGIYYSYTDEETCVSDFKERIKSLDTNPMLCYYIYNQSLSETKTIKDLLSEDGFEVKESIGALLKNKADTECTAVYHPTKNCAAIFIQSKDIRLYHMLISFMSLLFPSLFKDHPLEEADYNIIKSLSKADHTVFIENIQTAVQKYVPEFRRIMLGDLLKSMHQTKIAGALEAVTNQRYKVKQIEQNYADAMALLKELIVCYEGTKVMETFDKPEEDLVDYLSGNKMIHNLKIDNGKLRFTVATLLNNYNETAWATFADRGYIYDGEYTDGGKHTINLLDVFRKRENRKLLLDNIFSATPEFAVKIAGNYILDFNSCYITTNNNYDYVVADPMYKSYIPNPHLKIFRCLGGYERRVNKALQDANYIAAIEMCCASAGSVDLDETEQTFRPFIGWIMSTREKVLRRKDGVDMTPEEALLYLIDKEKANETN